MGLTGFDLKEPAKMVAAAIGKLAEAHSDHAKALDRIAAAMEQRNQSLV